jgi:flagellar biosynthetic protein FliR
MPADLWFSPEQLVTFLLVLARIAGILVFLPWPGLKGVLEPVRIMAALCLSAALFPLAAAPTNVMPGLGQLVLWILGESVFGLIAGVIVGFAAEALVLAAQIAGLQAGFSYASTIDPTSEADSAVLQILTQLTANILFFACGFDRIVLGSFLHSLQTRPLGSGAVAAGMADQVLRLGSSAMELGLRLALPVVGLLFLTDVTIALLSRLNSQLQLLGLSFPLKMLGALCVLAALAPLFPRTYQTAAERSIGVLVQLGGK